MFLQIGSQVVFKNHAEAPCLVQLTFGPIAIFPEMLPFVGKFVGRLVGWVLTAATFTVALALSLVTIGLAWFAVRPLFSISLLLAAGVCALLVHKVRRQAREKAEQRMFAASAPYPDPQQALSGYGVRP